MQRGLLVIDVQQEYFHGALPITYPVGHLENILSVMDEAHKAKIPTAVIRHHQPDPDSPIFQLNSEQWQLHPAVEARPRDILIDKQFPGAFTNTDLADWVKQQNIETVCIAGYMTHMCCDTTARQAFHRGLGVEFLNDATGTLDVENTAGAASGKELQTATLVAQQMFFGQVISSADWAKRLYTAFHAEL